MDKKEPGSEPCEDVTRESLIAISYQVSHKDLTAQNSCKDINDEKVTEPLFCYRDEKYRSKLISLSDSPPPDVK